MSTVGLSSTFMYSARLLKREMINAAVTARAHLFRQSTVLTETLRRDGVAVISGFYSPERCAALRSKIDELITRFDTTVWRGQKTDDKRLFGAERFDKDFQAYFDDPRIRHELDTYDGGGERVGCVMAARMDYTPGNIGSGEGWHRDRPDRVQTKSIIYLSDVGPECGPFQYLVGSHRPVNILRASLLHRSNADQYRFTEQEIAEYASKFPDQELRTYAAPVGSLILADVRGLHRGSPIRKGSRYAMTNYFWVDQKMPEHVKALSDKLVAK